MSTEYAEQPAETTDKSIDFAVKLPKKKYQLRCIECEFKIGKEPKNTPYLQRTWEIVSPSTVTVNDQTYNIAGIRIKFDNVYLTAKNAARVKADSVRLGVEIPDNETPNTKAYLGKLTNAILVTEEDAQIDEETKEPITDADDKPVIKFYHRIQEFI